MIKWKRQSNNIKNYMIVLIAIFMIASVLTNFYFFKVIDNISIESALYQKIKASKDLKADILPPKLYIVESYLIVQQIVNEKDDEKTKALLEKMTETREDYFNYYAHWQNKIDDERILKLLASSHAYVTQFYAIYDDKFTLAVQNKEYQAMQKIANSEMKPLFEKHRELINDMSGILETSNSSIESNAKEFADHSKIILFSVYIISLFIILVISLIVFKKVTNIEKNIIASQHETEMANERLETMVEGLKKFKHSYDNILASINGYVMREDHTGLKSYLDEIIVEKNKNEVVNFFKLDFIRNPAITGLIISKMMDAEGLGVAFALKVRSDVNEINMKTSHLCEVLGILLDNAIEAALESDDKKVDFKIEESEEAFVFEIKNSIRVTPDRIKMFEKGWTTKGENRGFGLWLAKEIVEKYDHVLLNSTVDTSFVEQDLLVLKETVSDKGTLFTDIL